MSEDYHRPSLAVDLIIERNSEILLIKRKNEPFANHLALPGGFVNADEETQQAAARELREETGVIVPEDQLHLIGVFSKPNRDPRDRVVSIAYGCAVPDETEAIASDDAKAVQWIGRIDALERDLAFDHREILLKWLDLI